MASSLIVFFIFHTRNKHTDIVQTEYRIRWCGIASPHRLCICNLTDICVLLTPGGACLLAITTAGVSPYLTFPRTDAVYQQMESRSVEWGPGFTTPIHKRNVEIFHTSVNKQTHLSYDTKLYVTKRIEMKIITLIQSIALS